MAGGASATRIIPLNDPDHRHQLFALYAEILGTAKAERLRQRFDWQYGESAALHNQAQPSWVMLRDNRVIGYVGFIHVALKVGAEIRHGCWGIDLLIHPAHRTGKGTLALFATLDGAAALPMGYGMADHVGRIYERRGYRRLGIGSHLIRFSTTVAAARLAGSARQRVRNIARHIVRRPHFPGGAGAFEAEITDRIGAELDALWERIAPGYPIAVVRDRRYLAWRYGSKHHPARFVLVRRGGRLEACAVIESFRWRGLSVGQISELLIERTTVDRLVPVVLYFVSRVLESQGVDAILTEGFPSDIRGALQSAGFFELDDGRKEILVFLDRERRLASVGMEQPDRWLLTAGDSDRSTAYPRVAWET